MLFASITFDQHHCFYPKLAHPVRLCAATTMHWSFCVITKDTLHHPLTIAQFISTTACAQHNNVKCQEAPHITQASQGSSDTAQPNRKRKLVDIPAHSFSIRKTGCIDPRRLKRILESLSATSIIWSGCFSLRSSLEYLNLPYWISTLAFWSSPHSHQTIYPRFTLDRWMPLSSKRDPHSIW